MKKKVILFTASLKLELDSIKEKLKQETSDFFSYKFLLLWLWNYETIFSLQNYLSKNEVDFVINLGVCWYKQKKDFPFFQVYRIKNLANNKEALIPIYFELWELKSIASSEKILTNKEALQEENFVDMESYGIDFVCSKYHIPFSIFKIPFDEVSKKSLQVSKKDLQENINHFSFWELLEKLKFFFSSQKEEIDFSPYFNNFSFTFSEKEILKKLYYKFEALGLDFENFFKENKQKDKKDFLTLWEKIAYEQSSIL